MNIAAYIIYLTITLYITIVVGGQLHQSGKYYLIEMFGGNNAAALAVNNTLLGSYYLLNMSYAVLQIHQWETVMNYRQLVESVSEKVGWILLLLAAIHVSNLITFYLIRKYKKFLQINKYI